MEGLLMVPPDRGTILGRALWKPRYVVVGPAQREPQTPSSITSSRLQSGRSSTPKALNFPGGVFLSIYKSKDDTEPVQQHAIATITDCQVQMIAHRKQGPVLPTLVINIIPDPVTDKLRKRRSSRTAGLTATKETAPTTLFFRPPQDTPNRPAQENPSLQEWSHAIHQSMQSNLADRTPLSPMTPASPTFINPFAPRPNVNERPGSGNTSSRPPFLSKGSNHTNSSRERDRPLTYSETHSLRSKPSDLSSHTSSMNPSHMGFHQHYTTVHPTDLPSPATTVGDYQGEFIEGWTSAQGRSSTLSSPVRTRDSVSSQFPLSGQSATTSSSPPAPRETILDRAFQLRYIPGSEREVPGDEKLSSLARFDALMREADEKRKREAQETRARAATITTTSPTTENSGLKSAWDLDDSSDSDGDDYDDGEDDDSDEPIGEMEQDLEDRFPEPPNPRIKPSAQRALEYISRRQDSGPRQGQPPRSETRSPLSYNQEALMALSNSGSSHLRPQTGYSKNRRPAIAQRTHSQPQLAGMMTSSTIPQAPPPVPAPSTLGETTAPAPARSFEELARSASSTPTAPAAQRSAPEKRLSTSSTKRQSFTEFTKRLSSTSSLLLFPGGSSNRGSNSDMDAQQQKEQQQQQLYLHHLHPRSAPPRPPSPHHFTYNHTPPPPPNSQCGWRGSVGVFGAEGGFL